MKYLIALLLTAVSVGTIANELPGRKLASIAIAPAGEPIMFSVEDQRVFVDWSQVEAEGQGGNKLALAMLAIRAGTWRPMSERKTR